MPKNRGVGKGVCACRGRPCLVNRAWATPSRHWCTRRGPTSNSAATWAIGREQAWVPMRLPQALGGPPSPATDGIHFGETAPTRQTPEATFHQQQADLSPGQRHIAFAAQPPVMRLGTDSPTSGAPRSVCAAHNRHFDGSSLSDLLAEDLKAGQSQGDQHPLLLLEPGLTG